MGFMSTAFLGYFRTANERDPLESMRSVRTWMTGLPANDPLAALEDIAGALETFSHRQPVVTAARIHALFTLDLLSQPMQTKVAADYRLHLRSEPIRNRLWQASNDLAHWFCEAYDHVCMAEGDKPARSRTPLPLHGTYARLFHYRRMQAGLGLSRYQSWIPANWKFLHAAYGAALSHGVAALPFALSPAGEALSAEQEFIQVLLLQRLDTGNQTAREIEWALEWLPACAKDLHLTDPVAQGGVFWVDLGAGLGLQGGRPAEARGALRCLDVAPLQDELGKRAIALAAGLDAAKSATAEYKSREAQLKLVTRLQSLWQPETRLRARRGERRADRRMVAAAAGWSSIIATLRAGAQEDIRAFRRPGVGAAEYPGLADSTLERLLPGAGSGLLPGQTGWQLQDTSDSGVRILSRAGEAQKLQAGALVALRDGGDMRWQAGIVRRVRRRTGEFTELGVERISRHALLGRGAPPGVRDAGYSVDGIDVSVGNACFPVLYLPPRDDGHSAPMHSVILPASEFAPGRSIVLGIDGASRNILLNAPLEQHEDWVWAGLELAAETIEY